MKLDFLVKSKGCPGQGVYQWLKHLLWDDPYQSWFLLTLAIINYLGSVYGYHWYREQLASTPLVWWPFTPDSPLATTLFALALTLAFYRRESQLLRLVAALATIKYGLWAVVLITDYWLATGQATAVEAGLWLSHLGMLAEGYLFLRHWRVSRRQLIPLVLWLGLNDFVDYGLGMHPYLFTSGQENLALATAVSLSLALILYLAWRINWSGGQEK